MNHAAPPLLFSLQIGRGLAALAVVLHHCAAFVPPAYPAFPEWLHHLLHLGYFGVDYFFVLSGFIIAYVTHNTSADGTTAKRYALSRLLRIYAPYYPIALGLLLAFALLPQISSSARDHYSLWGSLTLLPSDLRPALGVAWTLQQELVFYFLFAICHFLLRDGRWIFLWAIPILLLHGSLMPRSMVVVFSITNLEFLLGCAAYYCFARGWFRPHWRQLLILGIALVAATLAYFYAADATGYRVVGGLGFFCILLALCYRESAWSFKATHPLVFLGSASYAIYLVHGPIVRLLAHSTVFANSWILALTACVTASIFGGCLYYTIYEKPALHYLRTRLLQRKNAA